MIEPKMPPKKIIFKENLSTSGLASIGDFTELVCLLTCRDQEELDTIIKHKFLQELVELGCDHFICVGLLSETLHDVIDDIILDLSFTSDSLDKRTVLTSWFVDEESDEIANFFLLATDPTDVLFVAYFDSSVPENAALKQEIIR